MPHKDEEIKEDIKEEVQEAKDEVEQAEQEVQEAETPSEIAAAEARLNDAIAQLTARQRQLESTLNDLRTSHEGKAEREHSHPVPSELSALHEHLSDIEKEESNPVAVHWWKRRAW